MVQTCSKCSRVNPAEAVYCFHDGFALGNGNRRGGPVAVGAQPFNSPFVFPTGRTCRSFDELALACQEEWSGACNLLREGYLESFFGGLGRVDLVMAAKEAVKFPDPERGLDGLLAKLPTNVLADPKLNVEPTEVNLGLLDSSKEREFDLELDNQGMRLLYGTVSSSEVWLTLGESPGANEKHFHFTHDSRVKVHVWPDRVRASNKAIHARLLVESNSGPVTVKVRCEKPVVPISSGPLAGCKTPRQVAEKAKANPKEIAPLFATGEVEKWYAVNGWQYPVTVPAASGIAGIQQFFEALGLTNAPRVEINHTQLTLAGDPGAALPFSIEVSTQEKKPVFAHVTSSVPWIEVGKTKLNGQTATVNLTIPSVPDRPGQTLTAELDVVSNGKQRFRVPVSLAVAGVASAAFDFAGSAPVDEPASSGGGFDFNAPSAPATPPALPIVPLAPPPLPEVGKVVEAAVEPTAAPVEVAAAPEPAVAEVPPAVPRVSKAIPLRDREPRKKGKSARRSFVKHLIPAGLLALCILGVVLYDWLRPNASGAPEGALPTIAGPRYDPSRLATDKARVGVSFNPESRFGVVMLDAADPTDHGRAKRLTAFEDGASNNTIVRIGTSEYTFGFRTNTNTWVSRRRDLPAPYKGWTSTMDFSAEKVRVTQYVQIVPGADNVLDTVLIYYTATNRGTLPRKVAIRIMLDTFIGKNDGVPFTVPGKSGFVTTMATYTRAEIPDYLEVVENPNDPKNPGTIARLGLKNLSWGETELLDPEKVLICRFPGSHIKWDWTPEPMADDSCVAVYWPEVELDLKQSIHVAVTYGLGKLDITDQLALSAPAAVQPGREFIVTAYVYNATAGQKITLDAPGLDIDPSTPAEQVVSKEEKRTQIFWKVKGPKDGKFQIKATSEKNQANPITVAVQAKSIFG